MPENAAAPAAPDDDRTPTQEDVSVKIPEPAAWTMPEPVFRRSDGYTPQGPFSGNEDETITPDAIAVDEGPDETVNTASAASSADIAEQPEIHEDSEAGGITAPLESTAKKKTGWFRIFLIIAGIVLIALAAATVIFGIALGYFFQVSESQNLN